MSYRSATSRSQIALMAAQLADEQWILEQREAAKERQSYQWAKRVRQNAKSSNTIHEDECTLVGG